jgi:hypothetical protein
MVIELVNPRVGTAMMSRCMSVSHMTTDGPERTLVGLCTSDILDGLTYAIAAARALLRPAQDVVQ